MEFYKTELKVRSFFVFLSFLTATFSIYKYSSEFLYILTKPSRIKNFIFTDIAEAFQTNLQISYKCALVLILPFVFYQIFCFFAPGLFIYERRYHIENINIFLLSILMGTLFGYKVAIPILSEFLLSFQILDSVLFQVEIEARIGRIIEFNLNTLIISECIFCLPWTFMILYKKGILERKIIFQNRNIIYFSILLISALFCPPEVNIQILTWCLLISVFEFILFLLYVREFYTQSQYAENQHSYSHGLIAQLVRVYA